MFEYRDSGSGSDGRVLGCGFRLPGPQKSVNKKPFRLCLMVLGSHLTYFWGRGRACALKCLKVLGHNSTYFWGRGRACVLRCWRVLAHNFTYFWGRGRACVLSYYDPG